MSLSINSVSILFLNPRCPMSNSPIISSPSASDIFPSSIFHIWYSIAEKLSARRATQCADSFPSSSSASLYFSCISSILCSASISISEYSFSFASEIILRILGVCFLRKSRVFLSRSTAINKFPPTHNSDRNRTTLDHVNRFLKNIADQ